MKIVVFGGSGFLGSYLVEALVMARHDVTVFDLKEAASLNGKVRMVVGSILDQDKVKEALRGCEVAYNMVSISDIEECVRKPIEAVEVNILGNTVLLEACVQAKVKRFVLASTLYVYSSAGGFYRSTKQAAEAIVEDYKRYYGLNYTVLRYGTPYGPRADGRNSVHRFLKQAFEQGKIDYDGTGEEVREYIHAHDAAMLSVKILDNQYENERVVLSGLHPTRIKDFFVMINEIFGNTLKINYLKSIKKISDAHYQVTPYSYNPKIAKKLVLESYLDLGQGILDCIESIKMEQGR